MITRCSAGDDCPHDQETSTLGPSYLIFTTFHFRHAVSALRRLCARTARCRQRRTSRHAKPQGTRAMPSGIRAEHYPGTDRTTGPVSLRVSGTLVWNVFRTACQGYVSSRKRPFKRCLGGMRHARRDDWRAILVHTSTEVCMFGSDDAALMTGGFPRVPVNAARRRAPQNRRDNRCRSS